MHRVFLLYLLHVSSFLFSMDQQDPTIKKIILMQDPEQVAFLGNDILVMYRRKYRYCHEKFHMTTINLLTDTSTNVLEGLEFSERNRFSEYHSLVVNDNKEKIMFIYAIHERNWHARIYDKKGNIHDTPQLHADANGGGWPLHGFVGEDNNQLLFTTFKGWREEINSYNYTTSVFTLEENITAFVNNISPALYAVKYLPRNKIICGRRGALGCCVYDLTNHQLTNDIPLSRCLENIHSSLDGSFILFNYNSNKNSECDRIIANGGCCSCHKIPIVFLKNNEIIEIVDENDDPKKNHQGRCGLAIHPNNRVIARLKNNEISYYDAYTEKKYDCTHEYNPIEPEEDLSYFYTQCLSFSLDGTLVAGAFPGAYVVFTVPFEVRYGIHIKKEKLFTMWIALKKCQADFVFPPDILHYIMKKVWKVSKWIE